MAKKQSKTCKHDSLLTVHSRVVDLRAEMEDLKRWKDYRCENYDLKLLRRVEALERHFEPVQGATVKEEGPKCPKCGGVKSTPHGPCTDAGCKRCLTGSWTEGLCKETYDHWTNRRICGNEGCGFCFHDQRLHFPAPSLKERMVEAMEATCIHYGRTSSNGLPVCVSCCKLSEAAAEICARVAGEGRR